jgi:hypothetical protein
MPTTATGTVTINAAFLQEIKDDNQELRQLLQQVARLTSRPGLRVRPRRVPQLLDDLRDQLAMHFALEEAYGYFEDAVSVAPRLCYQAEQLRNEHTGLFLEICRIAEQGKKLLDGETSANVLEQLESDFAAWRHRFAEHERREINLVLAAFDDDIGVGD